MFGRLLACLALLTGLAAVGTPANASIVEALNCEIGVSAESSDSNAEERRNCHHDEDGVRADDPGKDEKPAKRTRRVMRPPVLYGIDRAHE